jgi:hypothetical protein
LDTGDKDITDKIKNMKAQIQTRKNEDAKKIKDKVERPSE